MIRCPDCRRRFGGEWGFKLGHPITLGRCRTVDELKAAGLRRRRGGVWVRTHSRFQIRLFDARVPADAKVRRWFDGRSYRSLTDEERSEYRRRLAVEAQEGPKPPTGAVGAKSSPTPLISRGRNAQSHAGSRLRSAA